MTPEEFEALPLAIQRKVCELLVFGQFFFFFFLRSTFAARASTTRVGELGPKVCGLASKQFVPHLAHHWFFLQVLGPAAVHIHTTRSQWE
jgi:hypothetical protein